MKHLRKRLFLYCSGALGLIALWYFFLYTPTHRDLLTARGGIATAEKQLADYSRTIEQLPSFMQTDRNLETLRRRLNSSLYAKNDILRLFRELTSDAETYGLKLVQISPPVSELLKLNDQASADYNPLFLNVTLDFQGHYIDFGQFVSRLETRPYFRSARSCLIRGQQTPSPAIDMSLSFKALLGTVEVTS